MSDAINKDTLDLMVKRLRKQPWRSRHEWTLFLTRHQVEKMKFDPVDVNRKGYPGIAPPATRIVITDYDNDCVMVWWSDDPDQGMCMSSKVGGLLPCDPDQ